MWLVATVLGSMSLNSSGSIPHSFELTREKVSWIEFLKINIILFIVCVTPLSSNHALKTWRNSHNRN